MNSELKFLVGATQRMWKENVVSRWWNN